MLTRRTTPIFANTGLPVCLLAIATVSTASKADLIDWLCPEGGLFEDVACWSTGNVPISGDTAIFDLGETYTLFTANDRSMDSMSVLDDLSLDINGNYDQISLYNTLEIGISSTTPEAALRVVQGNLYVNTLYLGATQQRATLQLNVGTYMSMDAGFFSESAVFDIEIGAETESTVVWYYGFDSYFRGTLVASHRDDTELAPLGSDFTLFSFSPYTMNQPFDAVITNPPLGRSYIISGNYSGSSEIVATVTDAPTIPVPDVGSLETLSEQALAIEVGDLNDDLIDDIVILLPAEGKSNGKMRIYVNDGTGGYSSSSDYEVGLDPVDLAIGDFDGDFINDVAVIDQSASTLWVYLNRAADPAALDPPVISSTEAEPTSIVTCNLGEDDGAAQVARNRDLVITNKSGTKKATGYRSNGSGGIREAAFVEVEDDPGPADSEDEERKDDDTNVGIGHGGSAGFTAGGSAYSLTIITTHEDGTMTLVSNTALSSAPMAIAHANLDGDSAMSNEVVVGTENGDVVIFNEYGSLLGNYVLGNSLSGLATGDIDNSNPGFDDIIASIDNDGEPTVVLLSNLGVSGKIQLQEGGSFDSEVSRNGLVTGRLYDYLSTSLTGLAAITNATPDENPEVISGLFDRIPTPLCAAADFNGNSNIDGGDLGQLIAAWGPCSGCPEDLNDDGVVDGQDLGLFLTLWGPCEL